MNDFCELKNICIGDRALNRREHQVMAMYAYGFNDPAIIGDYLGLSRKDVSTYLSRLRHKFELPSYRGLARIYESKATTLTTSPPLAWEV
jgi:DNA-binding CsgD family transcriptional regulator